MFKRWWWIILVSLVAFPVLGLLVAGVTTYVMPEQYESTAVLQIRAPASNSSFNPEASRDFSFATEFEHIRSQATLDPVIDQLFLTSRWNGSRDEIAESLRDMISTTQIRGTGLIEIRVRATPPDDAHQIAQSLADFYSNQTSELAVKSLRAESTQLSQLVRIKEDQVEAARKNLENSIRQTDLLYYPPGSTRRESQSDIDLEQSRKDFELLQREFGALRVKQVSTEVRLRLLEEPVIIHAEANPPRAPSSPNISLNLAIGVLAGILAALILSFPLMALLHRKSQKRVHP